MTLVNFSMLLPGGKVMVDGVPSDDFVVRAAAVLLPLFVALLGIALFRAKAIGHRDT